MTTVKTYLLENLCCENCAAAIERETAALPAVSEAKINYDAKKITIAFEGGEGDVFRSVSSIAAEIDEDIITKEI
jgi:Cd2+/Zn2+-exporting ATPase